MTGESFEAVAPRLLPAIRSRAEFEILRLEADDGGDLPPVLKTLGDHLAVLVVLDGPDGPRMPVASEVNAWERPADEVLKRAIDNLRAMSPCRFRPAEGGFVISDYGDGLGASRLLLPEVFAQLELKGPPVAVAVTRDCLVVAGGEDVAALRAMAAFVYRTLRAAEQAVSYAPLILGEDGWRPFKPDDAALAPIRALTARQRAWDAEATAQAVADWLDRRDRLPCIAGVSSAWVQGRLRTWTTWPQGKPALLPRTEALLMLGKGGMMLVRSWEDAEAAAGGFEAEPGIWPVRYRAERWPSPEAFARLATESAEPDWFSHRHESAPAPAQGGVQIMFRPLLRYADFHGRAGRKEFWLFALFCAFVVQIMGQIAHDAGWRSSLDHLQPQAIAALALYGLVCLVLGIPFLAVSVRRLHDTKMSGWWALLYLVPYLGWAAMAVLALINGSFGPNRFGPDPTGSDRDARAWLELPAEEASTPKQAEPEPAPG